MKNVAVIGASGYTGIELLRILSNHRYVNVNQITSRQYKGKALKDVFPFLYKSKYQDLIFTEDIDLEKSDIYFLCLPHDASLHITKSLKDKGKIVIDLSAAYRIKDKSVYLDYYNFEHPYDDLLNEAVYGLPEIYREDIKKATIIANPGCYPTSIILALYPVVDKIEDIIIINSLSGISGAGRHLKEDFLYPEAFSNAYAYSVEKHRHTPEIEFILSDLSKKNINIRFIPHIIPVSRGMLSTINIKINLSKDEIIQIFKEKYKNEPFIRISDKPPRIKEVAGTNFCDIYITEDKKTGLITIISAIDNLGKGASSQAIQNMNIILNIDETEGLINYSIWP
ncbi:N-acetyl-gamma-glutamyl-phosphate reductase [Venenivibrio stagnispumantis]|uniref:N-acetyl-gamma-glutamyl-phosphate reductase n=1 Tax=Venenivibrio stagnispumantis TaxID=407998 RepID=A0AA45WMW6_9AQUI|nr:N-acetyl-gamma-glutamyl-phosphate reductase [Venenivibrio stagnispumantis]MCW4573708.1 N-acetyl-gamma-glutamyl-phosphate reductase [Venenivibrio stagnispumantis]SMP16058.1 N-acetyl-gamma-glutamyl-phosphate reductase [Venenivibrio stagnispumantis]